MPLRVENVEDAGVGESYQSHNRKARTKPVAELTSIIDSGYLEDPGTSLCPGRPWLLAPYSAEGRYPKLHDEQRKTMQFVWAKAKNFEFFDYEGSLHQTRVARYADWDYAPLFGADGQNLARVLTNVSNTGGRSQTRMRKMKNTKDFFISQIGILSKLLWERSSEGAAARISGVFNLSSTRQGRRRL